ncbi:hypothetical protein OG896_18980 [Streptomyces sp. NBC_00669]|uniref:hypothetical protein n=1 Tax=Streptomyces sp. NBC_00669 TaxID=2976011 RepID=UPI002E36F9FD|nr:hypothetical protein [Streptomyces sp. NBC_00669]
MKRTTFGVAAALLLLAAATGPAAADGGSPAPAPTAPATWQPRGSVLDGAATTADAPAMKAGVTYRDSIKPGETRMYGIALDAKSSAYASAFAVPRSGSKVTYDDGLELKLVSADGSECDSREGHFDDDGDARPVGTAVERATGDEDDDCRRADQYTLQVHRTSDPGSDQAAWPLELRYVLEPPLKPGSVPPPAPATTGATASPTPLTTGTVRQASGGPSFETAAAIRTGVWKDRVPPGETRFYKVPVDWGQQPTVFADFSSAPLIGSSLDFVNTGVRLTAFSPVRQYVDGADGSYSGAPTSLVEQLPTVTYANRSSDDDMVQRVAVAGWYYFAVTVHPDVAKQVSGPVPVTLRVQVHGAAQAAPAYSGNPGAAGIGVDAHDVAAAGGTATGGSSSSALRLVAYGAFAVGTLLLLVLAVWFGAARWRPARG